MEKRHIIREYEPDCTTFELYFDDDGLTEKGGDYCNNLFIVCNDRWNRLHGFNLDEYKRVKETAESILEGFSDVEDGLTDYDGHKYTYKDIMQEYNIPYTSHKCHMLKEWYKMNDDCTADPAAIAEYLTITTGKEWDVEGVYGYCQGDYCEVVYCKEHHNKPEIYGEVWLGCAKEFSVIDLDENGEEIDSVGGYIVADSEARDDEDYKRLVCEWAGIDEQETEIQMIDGYSTQTVYSYRMA